MMEGMPRLFFLLFCIPLFLLGRERPNVLWITCEDISPYLGSYGFAQAETPRLDRLAAEGIRYTHAYANAPVCAVARSTLLTGIYATTLGTHQMRPHVQTPEDLVTYPEVLRAAGFFPRAHRRSVLFYPELHATPAAGAGLALRLLGAGELGRLGGLLRRG